LLSSSKGKKDWDKKSTLPSQQSRDSEIIALKGEIRDLNLFKCTLIFEFFLQ
jgi:hypothetical protein